MSNDQAYDSMEVKYGADTFGNMERFKAAKRKRPVHGRRRGKMPQSVNGMHRRRRRKLTW